MVVRSPRAALLLSTLFFMTFVAVHGVRADPPRRATSATDTLRWHFDQVLATAQSPAFRALDATRRREEIRRISNGLFNWSELSERALGGDQWRARSAAERGVFPTHFAALAERAYMGQVEQLAARGVPPDPVRYLGETDIGETKHGSLAIVRTALMYPQEMPIDFLMGRRGTRWEVYDVWVDGVSAARNYAAQFRRVIAGESFGGLVDRIVTKNSDTDAALVAPPR